MCVGWFVFFFFKQKTAYEMRISDWSSDVCSSDLQGVEVLVGHDPDAAAIAAIAAIGTTERDELLAAKTDAAVAAIACDDLDFGFVDELHGWTDRKSVV